MMFSLTVFCLYDLLCFAIHSSAFQFRARAHMPLEKHHAKAFVASTSAEQYLEAGRAKTSKESNKFDSFDYDSHWYPVIWQCDLRPNRPAKITLFDVDYVVAISGEEVVAMRDSCPHKSAALSEGRITSCGSFQCAYHGWTFNGKTGECLSIPQVPTRAPKAQDRANAVAVPAQIVQGMVWIFPGGGLEKSLVAAPPPCVPEIDMDGYRVTGKLIRDFPIDWTILIENIMDPDHGLFAHQTPAFDFYSASKEAPQVIVEDVLLNDGKGWAITSKVDAVYKLLGERNTSKKQNKTDSPTPQQPPKAATATYVAPCLIWMGRRNVDTDKSSFLTAFWVSPTGTGKSRFLAAGIAKLPKSMPLPPRWFSHININNFLDQDTQLLATQQRHVLATESQLLLEQNTTGESDSLLESLPVRKKLYVYRTPSELLGVRLGTFFDATVKRVPNRLQAIRDLGGYDRVMRQDVPPREVVLDRHKQHTSVCPDSADFLRNTQLVYQVSKGMALAPWIVMLLASFIGPNSSLCFSLLSSAGEILKRSPGRVIIGSVLSALISFTANKIGREFFFKYDASFRNRDLDNIPKIRPDS